MVLSVASDDNSGYENARISYVAQSSGEHFLKAKADTPANGEEIGTGSYTLITREPDDHGDLLFSRRNWPWEPMQLRGASTTMMEFLVLQLGRDCARDDNDVDWFKIEAAADQVITLTIDATGSEATSRPMFEVIHSSVIVARGDGETGNIASTAFKTNEAGTYYM